MHRSRLLCVVSPLADVTMRWQLVCVAAWRRFHFCPIAGRFDAFTASILSSTRRTMLVAVIALASASSHAWMTTATIAAEPANGKPSADEKELTEVGQWIERLGHPSYATRVRAREQLQRMGLQAFDELHAAQFHPDSEIAMASRHLVSSLLVSWSTESDPEAVRDALDEYGAQNETERQNRMDRLAELPQRQGLAALCRLARFETSLRLSREAALAVMRGAVTEDESTRQREANLIREVLGPNERRAADWLRAYADDMEKNRYDADAWRRLIAEQREAMDAGSDPTATRPAVIELIQVCATRAVAANNRMEALRLSSEHLDLISPRAREVIDACSWAIDNQLHSLVLELRERHSELFSRQPILLYGTAEAMLAENKQSDAEKFAQDALLVDPLPPVGSDEASKLSPKVIEENAQRHREVSRELVSRGLFRWAEREYRHIIDSSEPDASIAAIARSELAEMLANLERHDDCVAVIEPILQRANDDQQYLRRLSLTRLSIPSLKSMMMFQKGLGALKRKDHAQARTDLEAALSSSPQNADVLIAMYRTQGDDEWKEKVRRAIASLALSFENQIQALRLQVTPRFRVGDVNLSLAEYMNQYAWLISNTEGNYQKALEYSLQSLELAPNVPEQLDTAGRCYFAVNDISNALRMQRRAIKLMPHMPPLQRQLAEFEAAEKAQAKQNSSNADG